MLSKHIFYWSPTKVLIDKAEISFFLKNLSPNLKYLLVIAQPKCNTAWKVSNMEFFLVLIFLYSDWIRRFKNYEKLEKHLSYWTAWKVFKYGVFSGLYFPVFGLNTVKYGPEKYPYLDTFHAAQYKKCMWVSRNYLIYFPSL